MYKIQGVIEGTAPFLYNRMVDPESLKNSRGSGAKQTEAARIEEGRQRVYRNGNGLYVPRWNFKKCLLQGIQRAGLKVGKSSMVPFVEATVFLEDDPLFGRDEADYLDERLGRIPPKTGAAAIIRRPAMNTGWRLPFTLLVVDDRRHPDDLRRGLEEAGLLVGLGSFRPEYGRFIVREWVVIN